MKTQDNTTKKINKVIHHYKCLNCGKEYNSQNALYKDSHKRIAFFPIVNICCPYCEVIQIDIQEGKPIKKNSILLKDTDENNKEVVYNKELGVYVYRFKEVK